MILHRFISWLNFFFSLVVFASCASLQEPSHPALDKPLPSRINSSRFEWAVQNYEAGKYVDAREQFLKLDSTGSEVASFSEIPFYLGMSFFRLDQLDQAEQQLTRYLNGKPKVTSQQDARMALLSVYEKTQQWDKLVAHAAETDKQTLFQDNRAFLKLTWARALSIKGEKIGALAVLKDAEQYLDGDQSPRGQDPDRDLWGRFYFTKIIFASDDCRTSQPNEKKLGKKFQRLYKNWLEESVDCYRLLVRQTTQELFLRESPWAVTASEAVGESLESWGQKTKLYLDQESKQISQKRELQLEVRKQLYRLMNEIDAAILKLKTQGIRGPTLEPIRKHVDLLLVSLS